jgi:hypothetical protein
MSVWKLVMDKSLRMLSIVPNDRNPEPVFDRHVLIHPPAEGPLRGTAMRIPERLLSHAWAIRQAELSTGQPSAASADTAKRCSHWAKYTALTLPLLNTACDGFRACIAFHMPSRPGAAPENTVYWAQARDEREWILFMLLMMSTQRPGEVQALIEGAQAVSSEASGPASAQSLSLTRSMPRFGGIESDAELARREMLVDEALERQEHVDHPLGNVMCFEGYPIWLPLTEHLLQQRGSALHLRVP